MLNMVLLGSCSLSHADGEPLDVRSRKEIALLVYLAHTGRPHRRAALADLLWDASSSKQSLSNLRTVLARLRKQVGDVLVPSREMLGYAPDARQQVDSVRFQAYFEGDEEIRSRGDYERLQEVLSLYKGDFLAGLDLADGPRFDVWVTAERLRLQEWMRTGYRRLAHYSLAHQLDGVEVTEAWVLRDPLCEEAYASQIQANFMAGDHGAALQSYEKLRDVMAAELDLAPSAETDTLAQKIRSHQLTAPLASSRPESLFSPDTPNLLELPLIGREVEFSLLSTAYQRSLSPSTQGIVLSSEAGGGRTRMVKEFLRWAMMQDADVLHVRATPGAERLPYQPFVRMLRERLELEESPHDLLAYIWLAELAVILPELRERYPDLATVPDPADRSTRTMSTGRLFEAVARLGTALSRRRSLVLCIDDWHLVDSASRDLLFYMGQVWLRQRASIFIVLTISDESLASESGQREWLSNWEREVSAAVVHLERLSPAHCIDSVAAWTGAGREPGAVNALGTLLYGATVGNPFFLVETVRLLAEEVPAAGIRDEDAMDKLVAHAEAGLPLPASIRRAILARLSPLPDPAIFMLVAGAVLGRDFGFEEVCQIADIELMDGLRFLDALLGGQILAESGDDSFPYCFFHEQIRNVVYTEAGPARRTVFHRRALGHLAGSSVPAAELAHHALAAREWKSAFDYSVVAGDDDMTLHATASAIRHYEGARDLLKTAETGTDTVACQHLYSSLGRAYEVELEPHQARDVYREMKCIAEARDSLEMAILAESKFQAVVDHTPK